MKHPALQTTSTRVRGAGGFTLIEMVSVIVVVAVIALVGAGIIREAFSAYLGGKDVAQGDAMARMAIERMTRELKDIRSATATDLPTFAANSISFIDINGNTIAYDLSGSTLRRTLNAGTPQPLSENISSLAFSYLRRDGQTVEPAGGTASNVYYITVSFTLANNSTSINYRGSVQPRAF